MAPAEEDVPGGQMMQAAAPAGAYEPAGQSVQTEEPGSPAKEPAAQSVQVDEAFARDCE
jgi:hypothetical protein